MGWFDRPEYSANIGLIDEIYRQYLDDPDSVSPAWREFFTENEPGDDDAVSIPVQTDGGVAVAAPPPAPPAVSPTAPPSTARPVAPAPVVTPPSVPAPELADVAEEPARPLRGAAASLAQHMQASLTVPTATSVRVVPARLLEVNRTILNDHLQRTHRGKVSFTHLIGFAVLQALAAVPAMTRVYGERDGRPSVVQPEHVNLGLAIDVTRPDGSRALLVPNVKRADTLSFAEFVSAYEAVVRKARSGKLEVADFAGTTVTITNPGTIGTVLSVPRLLEDQAAIIGVGAIGYPAEYEGADPATLKELGVGKVLTVTSTYDHRVIQGAESGEFLDRLHRLLLGEDDFYEHVFASMAVRYVPVRWRVDSRPAEESLEGVEKQARVLRLINMYRVRGHLIATLDPLEVEPPTMHAELDPASFGFTIWDLERSFATDGFGGARELPLHEILHILRDAYCRNATVEYMHISAPEEKAWIQQRVEVRPQPLPLDDQRRILAKLGEAEAFERFLQTKYVGQKRFGLEGAESLIPLLDAVLDSAAGVGMDEVVIGMSHRGRLNVLANTIGKSYGEIFREFEGDLDPAMAQGSGDVKYHLGAAGKHIARSGAEVTVSVTSNPSHLEAVNPVVEGIARAKQDLLDRGEEAPVLPLLVHGDAAFAGQGVVAETLNLSQLRGYRTGGTVHVVVNNQLGFTTSPNYGRSSFYATDVAKMIQAPIWHVNGDDPEACVRVARLAFEFRQAFKKDVVIDMWCYRRWGHNEADEPAFTQPLMYERIKRRPSVRKLYTEALVNRRDLSLDEAEQALEAFRSKLQQAFDDTHESAATVAQEVLDVPAPDDPETPVRTAVPRATLDELLHAIVTVPDWFAVHPKLVRWLAERGEALANDNVDWALAESLAFGSLLREGVLVRLSGQDTRRGTFSQRHASLVDQRDGELWTPLLHLGGGQAKFFVYDSLLSEFATMGFEYGYSVGNPEALVAWEAQFGDFVNGAQTIIDEFIAAAEDKWGQTSSLVLLLPHGYEGQGADHSSGRLERFLDLAAGDNLRITVPSTPAQYFHLLRRQAHLARRKPLIVMTPKSLLRLPAARSVASELSDGSFQTVLADPAAPDPATVERVVLCSGKVYYDLDRRRQETDRAGVALIRVEQLYPFPAAALRAELARYPDAAARVWVQEEPENMGGGRFVRRQSRRLLTVDLGLVSREEAASPATGSSNIHRQQQADLVTEALALPVPA